MESRRGFFKVLTGLVLLALPRPAWAKKVAFKLDKAEKLKQTHGWTILKIKNRNILFIRDSETTMRALSPECTHQKCTVAYNPANGRIECPCHKSAYSLDGKVVDGPAPAPLGRYQAEIHGERVIVTVD